MAGKYLLFQPLTLAARAAAAAPGMQMGTSVLLLPMLNPVDVAEHGATVDAITNGGFILGADSAIAMRSSPQQASARKTSSSVSRNRSKSYGTSGRKRRLTFQAPTSRSRTRPSTRHLLRSRDRRS